MKKRWVFSLVAFVGGGLICLKKWPKKVHNQADVSRQAIVQYYEQQGYTVHMYNKNNDLLCFHPEKKTKHHVFYADGALTDVAFQSKIYAYYYHFTNEFFFVAEDVQQLARTKEQVQAWVATLPEETIQQYGTPYFHFQTVDQLIGK